jgi:Domain of Unknown Function (DUF1206)
VATARETGGGVERAGRREARRPAATALFRAGFHAKGAVYAVIGVLALEVALGMGGRTTDSKGAIATIARGPVGGALVVLLALGFVGMALWFLVQAVADPDGRGRSGAKAIASRVGQGLAGIGYFSLAFAAVRVALGDGPGQAGNAAARSWTARALALPGGRFLVLAGAAVVLVVGAKQIWTGLRREFLAHLDLARLGPRGTRWATRLGVAGFVAQGAVFALVGLFFAQAALEGDPREATGFDGALATLARQPLGVTLLAAVAIGLLAYAAFAFVEGMTRRMG